MFLGMELDLINMEVRLPKEKLQKLKALILSWRGRKTGEKRDLLSLIGLLTHAGRAVRPGRAYTRWLINLSTLASQLVHFVQVNKEARVDLKWWHYYWWHISPHSHTDYSKSSLSSSIATHEEVVTVALLKLIWLCRLGQQTLRN